MNLVTLTVRHPCPFAGPLPAGSSVRVAHLCHRGRQATLELGGPDPAELRAAIAAYEAVGGSVVFLEEDHSAAMLRFPECACCRSGRVIPVAEADGGLHLGPSTYAPEGETYQFLVSGREFSAATFDRLPAEVRIVRVGTHPISTLPFDRSLLVPVAGLLDGLTVKQRAALMAAIDQGYYRIPRSITTEALGRRLGISRPGFQSLLRKAENRILLSLLPYLTVPAAERTSPTDPQPAAWSGDRSAGRPGSAPGSWVRRPPRGPGDRPHRGGDR